MTTYRYHSRLMVIVHSWQSEDAIDVTEDLISVSTRKNIERVGSFTFTLTARLNWLNRLFANDMVNIYYDPGDGVSGWTRVMFGYIDRVTRSEAVMDETGRISTVFTITGSDFMKAVDFTQIIFRPEMAQRADWKLDDQFIFNEISGLGSIRRGVRGLGSPDIIVSSLFSAMLGFGAQWHVPPSYAAGIETLASQNKRLNKVLRTISSEVELALDTLNAGSIVNPDASLTDVDAAIRLTQEAIALYKTFDNSDRPGWVNDLLTPQAQSELQSLMTAWAQVKSTTVATLYDIISMDFVEGKCIDGYADAAPIWTSQGALSNIMYRWSNRELNELAFDLRPVVEGQDGSEGGSDMYGDYRSPTRAELALGEDVESADLYSPEYSRDRDEHGLNHGFGPHKSNVPGVKYVPAMIMRERPYSTAAGIDMTAYSFGVRTPGVLHFGPVFSAPTPSSDPVQRVFYDYSSVGLKNGISPSPQNYRNLGPPVKHLDVATVRLDELTRMEVSRGDADMSNMIIFNNAMSFIGTKYNLPDFMPVFNLASIAREGVRLKEASTSYANFSRTRSGGVTYDDLSLILVRWTLLLDHWYQHNNEYLSGTIIMRPRADIRVGYRLDIPERSESYYVTDVSHSWEKGADGSVRGSTSLQVTRGQRNDPFPVYVPPSVSKSAKKRPVTALVATNGNRTKTGRLARVFKAENSISTTRAGVEAPADNALDKNPPPSFGPLIPGGSKSGFKVKLGSGNKPPKKE